MQKLAFILIAFLVVSCATENKQETVVRELAKKDAIEKLQLPEGTKFIDENIELAETGEDYIGAIYIVKVTVKSQDREGNEILKTYTLKYKKIGEDGLLPKDYELTSFE